MYNAKQGILSKAKVQSTALQPSTVKKIGKSAVKGLIGGTIIEKAAKGLGASWPTLSRFCQSLGWPFRAI